MIRTTRRTFGALLGATFLATGLLAGPTLAQDALGSVHLTAPSSPGSGYDQLARAIQGTMQSEGLASSVEVVNVAGGGGTVGLAQFTTSRPRGPTGLVIGFALVGGILSTQSAVTLADTVPLARLTGDVGAIVVPANSDIQTLADLVERLKADPGAVSWAGGSVGGIDHVTAGLFSKAAGVDPTKINYVVHAGGGEVLASVLGGHTTLGISGYEEFRAQIDSGAMRALAVAGPERITGVDTPTFQEAGVDLSIVNWRGLVAHPRSSDEDREALATAIATMVESDAWAAALEQRGWTNEYLPAEEFSAFLTEETERVREALREVGLVQ